MNVKECIKDYGITLKEFSEELRITRPTLNAYIKMYEQGEELPNSKYNMVFNELFENGCESSDEFYDKFSKLKYLIQRDDIIGVINYDMKSTDLLASVIDLMKSDMEEGNYDEDIYTFVTMLVTSYRREPLFKKFIRYFLLLNGILEADKILAEEKVFLSNVYKILYLEKYETLEFESEYFAKFLDKINEINSKKNDEKSELIESIVKEKISSLIDEAIREKLRMGFDVEDIDKEDIVKKILKNEK